ncbi:unnamed protein product [Adineta ricciae]|uniref:AH domain-containing protein n=1 Tax=Adineta ricciae TaxID=249248 RepID=A0A813MQR9_ADIRI|nr:unnamed protein product [Adineta ricciae]
MTSFHAAFGSLNQEQTRLNENEINFSHHTQESIDFSTIDLDQQVTPSSENHSSLYESLNDKAPFQTDSLSTAGAMSNTPSNFFSSNNFSSNSMTTDRRITMPDISRISSSSAAAVAAVAPTIDKFKQWTRTTYKCTKQSLFEKLGKTSRTVNVELDAQIEHLRETKRRYEDMLALARSYANHFYNLMQTQSALSDQFIELKQKTSVLVDEFSYNAETQRLLARNGETLFNALNFFISTMNTLCTKTIEDTITTIRLYENARLEYDACRAEIALLPASGQTNEKLYELEKYKEKYEQLKSDTSIKLQLLDENQTKVMKNQLLLFHNAIAAYFSGNKEALESTMKQFSLKVSPNGTQEHKSFIEQLHR